MQRLAGIGSIVVLAIAIAGCGTHYVTPPGGVSMAEIADEDLQSFYEREPASPFPANIAVVRVQDAGYVTKTARGYGRGRFTMVTARDIETEESFESIEDLPLVVGVAPVGRVLLPSDASTFEDLRAPAAKLRADMLLVYSVDTTFTVDGRALGPLSMISLGLIPNRKAHVTATVAGALVDVRTGFIYGTTEATAREEQRATIWSTELAIDTARLEAEERAFESFVGEFEELWSGVIEAHGAIAAPAAGAGGGSGCPPLIVESRRGHRSHTPLPQARVSRPGHRAPPVEALPNR